MMSLALQAQTHYIGNNVMFEHSGKASKILKLQFLCTSLKTHLGGGVVIQYFVVTIALVDWSGCELPTYKQQLEVQAVRSEIQISEN